VTAETLRRTAGQQTDTLRVEDLRVYYHTPRGAVRAVDGVSFDLKPHERLGFVGESGSGKTTIAMALIRLIKPPGKIEGGRVLLGETDVLALSEEQMRQLRLADIAMVAQGAMNSLNPVKRVRDQIVDALIDHGANLPRQEMDARVAELLRRVGLKSEVAGMFPHELSGGMKQRVVIAIAISLRPKVILADEPTGSLDERSSGDVIELLVNAQRQGGTTLVVVTHDLGVANQMDRVVRLSDGELARTDEATHSHDKERFGV